MPATSRTTIPTHQETTTAMSTQTPGEERERQLKPFAQFLQEQRAGGLHAQLSEEAADLVAACVETGKKGSITIKLTFAPQKDEVTMLVTDDVKVVAPKHDSKPALFFPDVDGNLQRSDPRQLDMQNLREVPGGKSNATPRDLKEANAR